MLNETRLQSQRIIPDGRMILIESHTVGENQFHVVSKLDSRRVFFSFDPFLDTT